MAICKHCGAEIEENLEYCPNCKQRNEGKDSFFDLDEEIKDGYNIFDDFDEFDTLFSQELSKQKTKEKASSSEEIEELPLESISDILEDETVSENLEPINLESIIEENDVKDTPNDNMTIFVLLNTASLQLIPTNIIALRSLYGSVNPTSIVVPVWIVTLCSLIAGIISIKLLNKRM